MRKYWCRECLEEGFVEAKNKKEAKFILQCNECDNDAVEGDICDGPMNLNEYRSYCFPDKYVSDTGSVGSFN